MGHCFVRYVFFFFIFFIFLSVPRLSSIQRGTSALHFVPTTYACC